jgi:hypothetical protein
VLRCAALCCGAYVTSPLPACLRYYVARAAQHSAWRRVSHRAHARTHARTHAAIISALTLPPQRQQLAQTLPRRRYEASAAHDACALGGSAGAWCLGGSSPAGTAQCCWRLHMHVRLLARLQLPPRAQLGGSPRAHARTHARTHARARPALTKQLLQPTDAAHTLQGRRPGAGLRSSTAAATTRAALRAVMEERSFRTLGCSLQRRRSASGATRPPCGVTALRCTCALACSIARLIVYSCNHASSSASRSSSSLVCAQGRC